MPGPQGVQFLLYYVQQQYGATSSKVVYWEFCKSASLGWNPLANLPQLRRNEICDIIIVC